MAQHHYLPRFYLKGFSAPEPPRNEVWVHRPGSGWDRRAIKAVAAEAGYYNFTDAAGQEADELEQLLGRVESVAATLIREKVTSRTALTDEERTNLALFVGTMLARIPGQRDHVGELMEQVAEMTLAVGAQAMIEDPRRWDAFKRQYEAMAVRLANARIGCVSDGGASILKRPEDRRENHLTRPLPSPM